MGVTNSLIFELAGTDVDNSTYTDDNSTYTYDYGSDTLCDDEETALWLFHAVFQPVLYSLIFLLGVAGNGLMVTVLLRRWHLLRITEIYLLHLALADLMLLFTFPFDIVDSVAGWLFGEFLCKLTGLVQNLNLHCGSFLLACIGFDRYLAIVHAIPSMQSRRPRTVRLTCITLWLACLGLSIPNAVFLSVRIEARPISRLSCFYNDHGMHANNWVLANGVLDHVCFFLPLAVMSYCYTAVVVTVCKTQKSQATQGAIRLALLVTVVFFFCWLPYNITLLIKTTVDLGLISYETCEFYVLLRPALDVTKSLGLSHCCLNPFLYAFVGVRFRNELIQLLCKLGCSNCLPFLRAQGHSRPSISDGATTTSTVLI
ncbi:C-X-C chemokine receptor type 5 isoform X1 [Anarrhichthys ocellatus]|uniref:C-X-C chemokine receptor type 5 isoform X1 n=2 Tax=Anarrhichthys ocellatus TaxID=433405 RepID=UPI0012EDA20E|nr:C-X-C chemokine receptor type 5-like isoform X1 [Anarrhichthys ocellatus]